LLFDGQLRLSYCLTSSHARICKVIRTWANQRLLNAWDCISIKDQLVVLMLCVLQRRHKPLLLVLRVLQHGFWPSLVASGEQQQICTASISGILHTAAKSWLQDNSFEVAGAALLLCS
jgi:hypothetical protein